MQDNIQPAQEMFQAALSLLSSLSTSEAAYDYYWLRSLYYRESGQYEQATYAVYKSMYLHNITESQRKRSELHYYLGQALLKTDLGEADAYLSQALHQPSIQHDPLSLACTALYKAKLHIEQQELTEAEPYIRQAQNLIAGQGDSLIAAEVLLTSGQIDSTQQDYADSDTHFVAGLEMLRRLGQFEELSGRAVHYARMLEERHMEHEALVYYKLAFQSSQKVGK